MSGKEKKYRLFFALWPDEDTRQAIVEAYRHTPQFNMNGRRMRAENIHLTLHFIGNVDEENKACLHQAAQSVSSSGFSLRLDYFGHFYKARVFWMGCHKVPEALKLLHHDLGQSLQACDYTPESRVYAPHVTLMRKLVKPGEMETPQPINWAVNDFVLVESIPLKEGGVQYEVIERYPLQ